MAGVFVMTGQSTANIAGHDQTIPGWEEKLERSDHIDGGAGFKPFHFVLDGYIEALGLDEFQAIRLRRRMLAVQDLANRMSKNMLKGVLKYRNQERSTDHWREMGFDDLVDAINYAAIERYEAAHPLETSDEPE